MIVVLGRPIAVAPVLAGEGPGFTAGGRAVGIARASAEAGARVEIVGSIGDDVVGDSVIVDLGRSGVGHAAMLRDPATPTPILGRPDQRLPRLERGDVELGLGYLVTYGVLVLAEVLPEEVEVAALDAAAFRSAAVIALVDPGRDVSDRLGDASTVLVAPEEPNPAFAQMVGRYAAELDRGVVPRVALAAAARAAGWEASR
jgi:hypothetical protein